MREWGGKSPQPQQGQPSQTQHSKEVTHRAAGLLWSGAGSPWRFKSHSRAIRPEEMLPWEHEGVSAEGDEGWLTACCWLACQEKEDLAPGILGKAHRAVKHDPFRDVGLGVNMALESQMQQRIKSHHCTWTVFAVLGSLQSPSALRVLEVISVLLWGHSECWFQCSGGDSTLQAALIQSVNPARTSARCWCSGSL